VGVSFGLDRIYDTLEAGNLFPENQNSNSILICCMDESALVVAADIARKLRNSLLNSVEIYPGAVKLKKQLDYANAKQFGWAIILGENEIQQKSVTLKNLITGEQRTVANADIHSAISNNH
jgi:histidyl-tRNA synthetase